MSLEDIKSITTIIQSIVTGIAIIIGGWWAYRKYILQREDAPKIQFELNVNFIGQIKDQWIIEVVATLENKGLVRHEVDAKTFDFHMLYLKADSDLVNYYGEKEKKNFALCFDNKITVEGESIFTWLPKHWNYTFIEPGVKQQYSRPFSLPKDCKYLIVNSRFQYFKNKRNEFHTASKTVMTPEKVENKIIQADRSDNS